MFIGFSTIFLFKVYFLYDLTFMMTDDFAASVSNGFPELCVCAGHLTQTYMTTLNLAREGAAVIDGTVSHDVKTIETRKSCNRLNAETDAG